MHRLYANIIPFNIRDLSIPGSGYLWEVPEPISWGHQGRAVYACLPTCLFILITQSAIPELAQGKDNCRSPKGHIIHLIQSVSRRLEAQLSYFWSAIVLRSQVQEKQCSQFSGSLQITWATLHPNEFNYLLCCWVAVRVWANSSIFQSQFPSLQNDPILLDSWKNFYMEYMKKHSVNLKTQDKLLGRLVYLTEGVYNIEVQFCDFN